MMQPVERRLGQGEVRDVLSRAEELYLRQASDPEAGASVSQLMQAAEEAGLPRQLVEQALRERLGVALDPPMPGEMVFAPSADGKYYVADVVEAGERGIVVRFLKGGKVTVPVESLRPCSLLPGERVVCNWPSWGWWPCTVISYNAEKRKVKVTDGWGSDENLSISEIRLDPPRPAGAGSWDRTRTSLAIFVAGLAGGAALMAFLPNLFR